MFTILKQVSITCIVCIGQTMVMLTGGIDLSVGSVAQGSIVGIPNQVILTIILFIIFIYALAKTTIRTLSVWCWR